MTFKYVVEQLRWVSTMGIKMFSRHTLAHSCGVDVETVLDWEQKDEIPKKYRSRVDHYIKERLKNKGLYEQSNYQR